MNTLLKFTIIILAVFTFLLQGINIYVANTLDVDSLAIRRLSNSIEKQKVSNNELEAEVLKLSSYVTLASRAAELGYQEKKEFVSVYDPIEVARAR